MRRGVVARLYFLRFFLTLLFLSLFVFSIFISISLLRFIPGGRALSLFFLLVRSTPFVIVCVLIQLQPLSTGCPYADRHTFSPVANDCQPVFSIQVALFFTAPCVPLRRSLRLLRLRLRLVLPLRRPRRMRMVRLQSTWTGTCP